MATKTLRISALLITGIIFTALTGMVLTEVNAAENKISECIACRSGKCVEEDIRNRAGNCDAACQKVADAKLKKCVADCDAKYGLGNNCQPQMTAYQLSECVRTQSCVK